MEDVPVVIVRNEEEKEELAKSLGISVDELDERFLVVVEPRIYRIAAWLWNCVVVSWADVIFSCDDKELEEEIRKHHEVLRLVVEVAGGF